MTLSHASSPHRHMTSHLTSLSLHHTMPSQVTPRYTSRHLRSHLVTSLSPHHIMSPRVTTSRLMSPQVTSGHVTITTSHHGNSRHTWSQPHPTPLHLSSHLSTSRRCCIMLDLVTSRHTCSRHDHFTSQHVVTLGHFALHRCHLTSYLIAPVSHQCHISVASVSHHCFITVTPEHLIVTLCYIISPEVTSHRTNSHQCHINGM